jgi:hypothetical protein
MAERTNWSKDVSIVRQSAIKISLEFCKVHNVAPTLKELLRLTDILAEDALMAPDDNFKKQIEKVDTWIAQKKMTTPNQEK